MIKTVHEQPNISNTEVLTVPLSSVPRAAGVSLFPHLNPSSSAMRHQSDF